MKDGSYQMDREVVNGITLTLASWKPNPDYPGSYEIGYRRGDEFSLIQWDGLPATIAWGIVLRLAAKGRTAHQIRKVLDKVSSR